MNIYNFISQKYTAWKKNGVSTIPFVDFDEKEEVTYDE